MADEYCRITVVGDRRQVDLAVPAGAPITDYVDDLARLVAQEENELMPPAWSLATQLAGPFPPERSLADLGVADGQVLYLRDLLAGELDEPVVLDVAEQVAQASGHVLDRPWTPLARAATALAGGLAWLLAALTVMPRLHTVPLSGVGGAAIAAGVLLPMLAWVARERGWNVPAALRILLALAAVPLFAIAVRSVVTARWAARLTAGADPLTGRTGLAVATLAVGALLGAGLAYAACAGVTTLAVLTGTLVGAVTAVALVLLRADLLQSAGVAAVAAFLLLLAAPGLVGRIVAAAFRPEAGPEGTEDEASQVRAAVRTAMTLLAAVQVVLSLALGCALALLGRSSSPYDCAIALCLGLALLLRAGSAKVTVEVVPGVAAGAAGMLALVLYGPVRLGWPAWTAPLPAAVVAAGLLGYGLRRLMRRDLRTLARPAWFSTAGAVVGALSIPLVLAGFGVFGTLVGLGKHL
ncbi:EsaB/YukD family protein [Kitasatospora cinereorecta]|uniref:EsaB/YukD family protein n=1 Tax=Kitasatospora cinereorecta TaxID=285560 RepID=A0ABW0VD44_9ACTN